MHNRYISVILLTLIGVGCDNDKVESTPSVGLHLECPTNETETQKTLSADGLKADCFLAEAILTQEHISEVMFRRAELSGGEKKLIESLSSIEGVTVDSPPTLSMIFHLNHDGAVRLQEVTRDNVGRRMALVVDGRFVTSPVIQTEINEGVISVNWPEETEKEMWLKSKLAAYIKQ